MEEKKRKIGRKKKTKKKKEERKFFSPPHLLYILHYLIQYAYYNHSCRIYFNHSCVRENLNITSKLLMNGT